MDQTPRLTKTQTSQTPIKKILHSKPHNPQKIHSTQKPTPLRLPLRLLPPQIHTPQPLQNPPRHPINLIRPNIPRHPPQSFPPTHILLNPEQPHRRIFPYSQRSSCQITFRAENLTPQKGFVPYDGLDSPDEGFGFGGGGSHVGEVCGAEVVEDGTGGGGGEGGEEGCYGGFELVYDGDDGHEREVGEPG